MKTNDFHTTITLLILHIFSSENKLFVKMGGDYSYKKNSYSDTLGPMGKREQIIFIPT